VKNGKSCPVDKFFKIIGQKWSSYILWILSTDGALQFGQLKRRVKNISQKMLTQKLRELESAQILYRNQTQDNNQLTVIYSLTPLGMSLVPLLQSMSDIAHEWRNKGFI
jgi:DNA-binding HxlR family transcriptional regulator